MIHTGKRFVERYPAFVTVLIGLWLVVAPVAFGVYLRNLTEAAVALSGWEAWLEQFFFIHKNRIGPVFAIMSTCGVVLIGIGVWRMIRPWLRR